MIYSSNCGELNLEQNGKKAELIKGGGGRFEIMLDDDKKYTVGELKILEKIKSDNEDIKIWYSYNDNYHDFHIVPDDYEIILTDDKRQLLSKYINDRLNSICDEEVYEKGKITDIFDGIKKTGNAKEPCKCHKYKYGKKDGYEYLFSFNRLWYENKEGKRIIHNNLGEVQFMRYNTKSINYDIDNETFKMMYPDSEENNIRTYDEKSKHLVINPPYTIDSGVDEIAEAFIDFVKMPTDIVNAKK